MRVCQQNDKDLCENPDKRPEKVILRKNSQLKSLTVINLIFSFIGIPIQVLVILLPSPHTELGAPLFSRPVAMLKAEKAMGTRLLLGLTLAPTENKNNIYAKFWRAN